MPVERFYVDSPLKNDEKILIQEDEFHHLAHVLRMRVNDEIEIVNGKGFLAFACIEALGKHSATVRIRQVEQTPHPSQELILAQAITRPARLEYIAEKSVELGISQLWIFPGELSEKKIITPSLEKRLSSIFISALKQCGRLFLPKLVITPPVLSWKKPMLIAPAFFGDTNENAPPFLSILSQQQPQSLQILIGPEKGFHPKEVLWMKESLQIQGTCLHKNILRVDTAAICALSIASCFYKP